MTFIVTSSDSGEQYEVQMQACRPHGWCSCPDYQYRQSPTQRKTSLPQRCKHIVAVIEYLIQRMVDEYVRIREEAAKENIKEAGRNKERVSSSGKTSITGGAEMPTVQDQRVNRPAPPSTQVSRTQANTRTVKHYQLVPPVPRLGSR